MDGGVNPRQVAMYLRSPDKLASTLQHDVGGMGASPAEIMADIVNVQRADTKALADAHGVDVEVDMMTPDRAADLLAGVVDGDGIEIVLVFNELARKRDQILREALADDAYQGFITEKTAIMHTDDPDTFDDDDGGDTEAAGDA